MIMLAQLTIDTEGQSAMGLFEYPDLAHAEAARYSIMASASAESGTVQYAMVMILNHKGEVKVLDIWERPESVEPEPEPGPEPEEG